MNTLEIFNVLKKNKNTKDTFLGVFPHDMVPNIETFPACLVVNLDPSTAPGSHWVALNFNSYAHCEYFDSYGRRPQEILRYINNNARYYTYNNIQVQDFSTISCGHMCVYFLVLRSKGYSFRSIIKSMLDEKVYKYFLENTQLF